MQNNIEDRQNAIQLALDNSERIIVTSCELLAHNDEMIRRIESDTESDTESEN